MLCRVLTKIHSKDEYYLISSHKMNENTCIGQVDEPVRLIEAKSSQEVSRSGVPKSCITEASTAQVEESCNAETYHRRPLHSDFFGWI